MYVFKFMTLILKFAIFLGECKITNINDYLKDELDMPFKHLILQTNFFILFKLLV